jgi:hypothetical protein
MINPCFRSGSQWALKLYADEFNTADQWVSQRPKIDFQIERAMHVNVNGAAMCRAEFIILPLEASQERGQGARIVTIRRRSAPINFVAFEDHNNIHLGIRCGLWPSYRGPCSIFQL